MKFVDSASVKVEAGKVVLVALVFDVKNTSQMAAPMVAMVGTVEVFFSAVKKA